VRVPHEELIGSFMWSVVVAAVVLDAAPTSWEPCCAPQFITGRRAVQFSKSGVRIAILPVAPAFTFSIVMPSSSTRKSPS
jgi:hypothetical protein